MPYRLIGLLASVATVVAIALSPLGAAPVAAAGPAAGATFNDPTGDDAAQMKIARKIMNAVDGTPPGGTIRMTFYGLTLEEFTDKLIAAHERGVNVRVIMDDHYDMTHWTRLAEALGGDPTARSFALLCHRSCMTDTEPSYMHAKYFMFSSSGSSRLVVMVSSTNPTWSQARRGWNDAYTIVGNRTMYAAFRTNFEDLTQGALEAEQPAVSPDYYFTASTRGHKAYFFPRAGTDRFTDTMYLVMMNIKCTKAAPGYGINGRTVVRVAMYQWSAARIRLANTLWKLDDAGCRVEILYNPLQTNADVVAALRRPGGRNGGPTMWSTAVDENRDGLVDHYSHNKYMLVDGAYGGDTSTRLVFTGSANWTNAALRFSNEVILKIHGSTAHAAYLAHYVKLRTWAKEAKAAGKLAPVPNAPAGTLGPLERLGPDAD